MQDRFELLADAACAALAPGEACTVGFSGEESDFARLNEGRVRQAGTVHQASLRLRLVRGRRHVSHSLTLTGEGDEVARVRAEVAVLREILPHLPEDPHLSVHEGDARTTDAGGEHAPVDAPAAVGAVLDLAAAGGARPDLVGVWASGRVARGFASSWGQRSWFSRQSWGLDFCLVHQGDKAVKRTVSGFAWEPGRVGAALDTARAELVALGRPVMTIAPGAYRAWLAPAAMAELWGLLGREFGQQMRETKTTAWLSVLEGRARLDPRLRVREDIAGGLVPAFDGDGWPRPATVELVRDGGLAEPLVSARSAREFGVPGTGANGYEGAEALSIAPGGLAEADALAALGTGIRVSDLWYLNFSDRSACRITGMTRFATFWVEDGELVAPLAVMRFDDTAPRLMGEGLVALGAEAPLSLSTGTYFQRDTGSVRVPGALVEGFKLTL